MTDDIKPGDLVRVKPQYSHSGIFGVWVAEKKLVKNWELKRPDNYKGMNAHKKLRAKPYQLEKVTAENAAIDVNSLPTTSGGLTAAQAAAGQGKVVMTEVNDFKIIEEGAIVLVNDPSGKIGHGLYVVTKDNLTGNPGRVHITELGGGQKWRCPVGFLRVIPKGEFTIHVR